MMRSTKRGNKLETQSEAKRRVASGIRLAIGRAVCAHAAWLICGMKGLPPPHFATGSVRLVNSDKEMIEFGRDVLSTIVKKLPKMDWTLKNFEAMGGTKEDFANSTGIVPDLRKKSAEDLGVSDVVVANIKVSIKSKLYVVTLTLKFG